MPNLKPISEAAVPAALEKALMTQRVSWVLDLDIRTFFDSVDPGWLVGCWGIGSPTHGFSA